MSVGAAQLRPDDPDGWELLRRADAALYDAKRTGRNSIRGDVAGPARIGAETAASRDVVYG